MRFAEKEIYHVYNRGVEKREIFLDKEDYNRFLKGLYTFNALDIPVRLSRMDETKIVSQKERLVSVLAYVLMKNHVHLILYCTNPENLARFLQKIFIGYTMYFNKKYFRKGVLFESRSKSKHVYDQHYMNHIIDYVHLNPLDYVNKNWREHGFKKPDKIKQSILNYPYSSINGILGNVFDPILDTEILRELFENPKTLLSSAVDWSNSNVEEISDFILE